MASFDSALGMWKSKNGQYYGTQSEAIDAERNFIDDDEFVGQGGIEARAPDAAPAGGPGDVPNPANPGGISDNELRRRKTKLQTSAATTANINQNQDRTSGTGAPLGAGAFGAGGWYDNLPASSRANYSYMHELGDNPAILSPRSFLNRGGERVGVSHAGDVADPASLFDPSVSWSPEALFQKQFDRTTNPNQGLGTTADNGSGNAGRPVVTQGQQTVRNASENAGVPDPAFGNGPGGAFDFEKGAGRTNVDQETADAKNRAGNVIEENRDENAQLFADAFSQYDDLKGGDYGLSDEARGYQREGLQQQRQLLQKMLGFDENAFATRYADQALSRQIAAGRSAGGGYAGQQAGMFAAAEAAPGFYAEGQRQASGLANQRLQMAETAAKGFGDLGTMTRGQDEQRAQFESNLGLSIADSVSRLTEGNVAMNDRDSAQMAEIWMDFAKLQSVYAGMSSDEQLAWWQTETARRGQDKNFEAIMAQMKANGEVSSKDLIGGLFQLGGGVISTAGGIGNAYMQGEQNKDVARINQGQVI